MPIRTPGPLGNPAGYPTDAILGGGLAPPRIPWSQNPMVTALGSSLLAGRGTLSGAGQALGQMAPAAMNAKFGMQEAMQKRQEDAAKLAMQRAAMNAGLKKQSGVATTPEEDAAYAAMPEVAMQFLKMQPKPDKTSDITNFNFAKSQGYPGTFQEWDTERRKAGASSLKIDNLGPIPPDFERVTGPDGAISHRIIPGSKTDLEQKAAEKASEGAQEQADIAGDIVLDSIKRAKDAVENQTMLAPVTGLGGSAAAKIAGSTAFDARELVKTVQANVGFDRLQRMRETSPTGGALGAISEREMDLLQATMGSLSLDQSEGQALQNLKNLEKIYAGIMKKAAAYPNAGQFGFATPADPDLTADPLGIR